jgi:hypothetical protein
MKLTKRLSFKSALIILAFGTVLAGTILTRGEQPQRFGLVDDWTTYHVIFSNPGTAVEALAQGRLAQWYRIVNDPRYIMQQLKRNPAPRAAATAQDFATLAGRLATPVTEMRALAGQRPERRAPAPHRDWAFSLGSGTVAENMFPAKFTFNVNATPSCTSDFAVYGLNVAGATSGQANLVALNNLYSASTGTNFCGGTGPDVYWAYNVTTKTGGTITTSPVLSANGSEVIFVESSTSGSVLHILRWNSADGGTVASAKAPAQTQTSFGACTGTTSCLVSIALGTASSNTTTNSSPFYDYKDDIVYVGDDAGNLYKVTPVLGSGAPAVTKLNIVSSVGADTSVMTGPLYDVTSGYVFVGASNGILYAVTASSFALSSTTIQVGDSSCSNGYNRRLTDPPIVDSANGWVYEQVTTGSDGTHTIVEQASTSGPFTTTNVVDVGEGDSSCNSSTFFPTHSVEFDNTYYTGTVSSGHIWVCGRESSSSAAELWEIPTSGTNGSISGVTAAANGSTNQIDEVGHAQCSPFTEIYNTNDYLFFGEGLSGSFGRLYGFTLSGTAATEISGSPVTYPTATGGTSGIVIDNVSSDTQASSIYFTTLATSTSLCGSSSAYCAVKLTQAGLD